ncbi:hypothetical protein IT411_00980, partial [Candidatus Peregrinibacteria bacterium]|nr:hypothetical protein [Candidatus Peregrinibacteria bacterium]
MTKNKTVQKFRSYLGAFLLIANLLTITVTQAAATPASFAPVNAHYFIELNTNKEHPFKGKFQEMFQDAANGAEHPEMLQLLINNIENTDLAYSQIHRTDSSEEISFLTVTIDQDLFNQAVSSSADIQVTELGLGRKIYQNGNDFFFTYLEGNLVAASEKGFISDLLMQNQKPDSILKNNGYQNFNSKANPESFLKIFQDFQHQPSTQDDYYYGPVVPDWLKSQGYAFSQTLNGIEGQIVVNL